MQHVVSDRAFSADVLPHDQVYALICLADAGSDLESFRLRDWREAASVLRQVVRTCAEAETAIQFEVSAHAA